MPLLLRSGCSEGFLRGDSDFDTGIDPLNVREKYCEKMRNYEESSPVYPPVRSLSCLSARPPLRLAHSRQLKRATMHDASDSGIRI